MGSRQFQPWISDEHFSALLKPVRRVLAILCLESQSLILVLAMSQFLR
jgi:hypothetical protein